MFANTPLNATTSATLRAIKILSEERCQELFEKIRVEDCRKSYNAVVTGFMPLALSVASLYRHRGDINDLFQIGCLRLMDAARTFDSSLAVHFATHARTWIDLGIKRHLLCESALIKVPETKGILKCYRRMHLFSADRQPSEAVIKSFIKPLNATREEFLAAYELYFARYESTSQGMDDDSDPLESRLSNGVTLEEQVIAHCDQEQTITTINRLMNVLSEREQTVIKARMLQEEPVQLRIVSEEMGVSAERVRQIEKQALNKIRLAA